MKRRFLNTLTLLSLPLILAMSILSMTDGATHASDGKSGTFRIGCANGRVYVQHVTYLAKPANLITDQEWLDWSDQQNARSIHGDWNGFGIFWGYSVFGKLGRQSKSADLFYWHVRYLSLPPWFVALILAVLPFRWLLLYLRGQRRAHTGLCPACGYDLRATPEQCPECGFTPPSPSETGASATRAEHP